MAQERMFQKTSPHVSGGKPVWREDKVTGEGFRRTARPGHQGLGGHAKSLMHMVLSRSHVLVERETIEPPHLQAGELVHNAASKQRWPCLGSL